MIRGTRTIISLAAGIIILCSLPHATFAQTGSIDAAQGTYGGPSCATQATTGSGFVPLACYAGATQFQQAFSNTTSLSDYVNDVFKIALTIGGILAVMRIAYGGYLYMGSADMWSSKQQAREVIGDAVIGVILLFSIYLILNVINPNLLNLNVLKDVTPLPAAPAVTSPIQQSYNGGGCPSGTILNTGGNACVTVGGQCATAGGLSGLTNAQGGCDALNL